MNDLWEIEEQCFAAGAQVICGVDEAGRGPLAGPVCAAAVILPRGLEIPGLNDSKKLTDRKRRALYDVIVEQAAASARWMRSIFCRPHSAPWSRRSRSCPLYRIWRWWTATGSPH